MGEFDLIARIRSAATTSDCVALGIGDDCAILRPDPANELVVTTDMLLDGRHFRLGEATAEQVGYKSLAVNLSDIAAMGARPLAAFVAVSLPRGDAEAIAMGLLRGMDPLARRFGVALAGGDTNAWDGPLVVGVTVVGECPTGAAIRRDGARPGDAIYVTGPLGGSLLGRHLRPEPRLDEASRLRDACTLHAMIDISDGLLSDLGHICAESGGLGAVIDIQAIPIHRDALALARRSGRDGLDHALHDGEDFELCFTAAACELKSLLAAVPTVRRIGVITAGGGLRLRDHDGTTHAATPRGFDHLR
jgi:thiamine-monophosphate kinase